MVKYIRESAEDDFAIFNKEWDISDKELISTMPRDLIEEATLLSKEEAEKFLTQEERDCGFKWWLRSPGYESNRACFVDSDGEIYTSLNVNYNCGVRPALRLKCDLDFLKLKIGDTFDFGGQKFIIIWDDLALCENVIANCAFRRDYRVPDANDYEKSDVKEYVDSCFYDALNEYEE